MKKMLLDGRKVYIESLGCDSNKADTNQVAKWISKNKGVLVGDFEEANFIILMSCSFNTIIRDKNIGRLKEFRKNKKAKIILGGCMSLIDSSTKKYADYFFGPRQINKLEEIFKEVSFDINESSPEFKREGTRVIRISTGCRGKCSYCAIKFANGSVKSRGIGEIKKDIEEGLREGITRFAFTSEDVGAWGQDIGKNIGDLINEVTKVKGNFKIRLTTVHPKWFVKYPSLTKIFKKSKIENAIYLAIQHSSNKILKLMQREYTRQDYLKIFKKLKKENPGIKINCDFLVGFPGETEKDHEENKKLLKDLDFEYIQVFGYTDMKGTIAEKLEPKVDFKITEKRCKELIKIILDKYPNEKRMIVNTNIKL